MTEPINFNKARKSKLRADAKRQADENAVTHGRTKAGRLRDVTQSKLVQSRLDALKFDDE